MSTKNFILLTHLCSHYNVKMSFFSDLYEIGLIEIITVEQLQYIHQDTIASIEKMIRIHNELKVNLEGIDVVFNMLHKIETLQNELNSVKNRLGLYEN